MQKTTIITLPDYMNSYLELARKECSDRTGFSLDNEIAAYKKLCKQMNAEQNSRIKQFMRDRILYHCNYFSADKPVLLSYIVNDGIWDDEIHRERNLENKMPALSMLFDLERITSRFSSARQYTNQAGLNDRYPVNVPLADGSMIKIDNSEIPHSVSYGGFLESHYSFGSHQFYAGKAIYEILQWLEERYGLNFRDLERGYNN